MSIKKFEKAGELSWLFATVLVALGVAICKKADLGVSMIAASPFILYEAVSGLWSGFSVGMVEYLIQGLLLIVLLAVVQRLNWRYLLAFLAAVIYGYTLDLWLLILGTEPFGELWLRWVMLIVGDTVTALGVACFFRTYLPLQVYELFVAEVADRYRFSVNKSKMAFDICCLTVSIILAFSIFGDVKEFDWSKIYSTSFHSIGLGTLITTIINAPIITLWGKLLDKFFDYKPLFPKIHKVLARNLPSTKIQETTETENL